MRIPQLWSIDDIAAALDVPSSEVIHRYERGEALDSEPMPAPALLLNLGRTPVWRPSDILDWAIQTGRTRMLWMLTHGARTRRFRPWRRDTAGRPCRVDDQQQREWSDRCGR